MEPWIGDAFVREGLNTVRPPFSPPHIAPTPMFHHFPEEPRPSASPTFFPTHLLRSRLAHSLPVPTSPAPPPKNHTRLLPSLNSSYAHTKAPRPFGLPLDLAARRPPSSGIYCLEQHSLLFHSQLQRPPRLCSRCSLLCLVAPYSKASTILVSVFLLPPCPLPRFIGFCFPPLSPFIFFPLPSCSRVEGLIAFYSLSLSSSVVFGSLLSSSTQYL